MINNHSSRNEVEVESTKPKDKKKACKEIVKLPLPNQSENLRCIASGKKVEISSKIEGLTGPVYRAGSRILRNLYRREKLLEHIYTTR